MPSPAKPAFTLLPARLQQALLGFFDEMGILFLSIWLSLRHIAKLRVDVWKTLGQVASVGFDSLPMSVLICLIAGSVLALQTAEKFAQTGADNYVGGLVALAIVREIGPIFTCLAVGARAGTAIAAEIANMKITEQVDALRILGVDPIRYLMVPRLLACIIALPLLTVIGEAVAILGGMVVAQATSHLHYHKYLESVWLYLKPYDIRVSFLKAIVFGLILAAISCTVGLNARGGAKDVGLSTTRAVVRISIAIIIADFFLTWIFFGTSYE
ncbi:MAG TPA: ABC transporter permease [Coleofasciculaceae cyanobacterium]|jgi:phospholipid/cholesterol/gamma-HCH transport system permease protein